MASAMRVLCKIAELAEISEAPFWQCFRRQATLGVALPPLSRGAGAAVAGATPILPLQ